MDNNSEISFRFMCSKIEREGVQDLLVWLNGTDFFSAPCSTRFHLSVKGGLVQHSTNVANRLMKLCTDEKENIPLESLLICGLFHDVCKANFYEETTRNVKNEATGVWEKRPYYAVNDSFPLGHGEKSLYIISKYMKLTDEEALAIRWHMGGFDESVKGGSYSAGNAYNKSKLAVYLHVADLLSTYTEENNQ